MLLRYLLFPLFMCPFINGAELEIPKETQKLLGKFCYDCHDSEMQKGKFNIEDLLSKPLKEHLEKWEDVLGHIDARKMPPKEKKRPSEEQYESLTQSLIETLDKLAYENDNPGRTSSIRRLTRTEYQNAIRDLLDLDVDATTLLPTDPSSHGFDNITVEGLSPSLLERYISASQKISRLAIGRSYNKPEGRTVRVRPDVTQEDHVPGLPHGTRGGVIIKHSFPQDGEYEVRVHLARDRNEHVEGLFAKHTMEFLLNNKSKASFEIKWMKHAHKIDQHLHKKLHVKAGSHDLGITFIKQSRVIEPYYRQPYESKINYHRSPRQSPAVYQVSIIGPLSKENKGESPSRKKVFIVYPKNKSEELSCAKEIIKNLARKAYRRPATENDVKRLLPFFQEGKELGASFDAGIESILSAILVSREFLFRVEKQPEGILPGKAYKVNDLNLAERLSFFLWSSIPDESLLAAAENKTLGNAKALESQALRMLDDPKSKSLVTNFANQWLYLRNLKTIYPDGRLYPDFDDNLRQAFQRETELHFEEMIRENKSVLSLFKSNHTYVNERLAKHYGISGVYGTRLRKVELPEGVKRGGLLRHGSILTITSYATRTSPVIRGHWILENLISAEPPPAPPNVPTLEESNIPEDLPFKDRLKIHRENAACASCHDAMDPVGFALENFDAIGQWRDRDGDDPIDNTGGYVDGSKFNGVEGLEKAILSRPELFVKTFVKKLLTYGLGRGIESTDEFAIREILRNAKKDNYAFNTIVTEIVKSPLFTKRLSSKEMH
ncbi:MAG: DUF1592 domain-containing protein [Lentisphaeraceae bacterium]|nr:DUF1592 domain-containing protein [Lentisphaeraceae bacterium]